ncbi:uncharacterized protein [Clytia hemisphaerica]|uniref:uncharacterized protein n=1 Tax=Clytia hemisphaerica TaxID=252671 RepID=UPI0034D6FAD9
MANKNDIKAPPALKEDVPYENWKKEITIWQLFTSLEKKKQGLAILLSLEGKAREAALELEVDELNKDDGVSKVLAQLDKLYLKDKLQLSFQAYDSFRKFKRPNDMPIADFVVEFERLYNKAKAYEMILPDGILAYEFLNNANISDSHEKLIRATMTELSYNSMKDQLRKVFGDLSLSVSSNKSKDVGAVNNQVKFESRDEMTFETTSRDEEAEEVYYGNYRDRSNRGGRSRPNRGRFNFRGRGGRGQHGGAERRHQDGKPRRNPSGPDGAPSTCMVCGSVFHWARDCPDSYDNLMKHKNKSKEDDEIALFSDTLKQFVGETLGTAVLDSGCTKNVCGKTWLGCYLETLDKNQLSTVKEFKSSTSFKFGNGDSVESLKKVKVPAYIGGKNVFIETDVIDGDLPLLLSKDAMKKAEMNIDFIHDNVTIFGQTQKLMFTSSGHYCIPLGYCTNDLNSNRKSECDSLALFGSTNSVEEKKGMMQKLHRQFSHAPYHRIKSLLKDAGVDDQENIDVLKKVCESCKICQVYKKTPQRPVVGLSMAHHLNETVAMDLKEWKEGSSKTWFLHLVDHATRYSASSVIKSKKKEVITTAAESPWSNGLVERHNGIIGENVTKIVRDVDCELRIALSWAVSAKNALHNIHGFSPNQLVFGRNPNFPSVLTDKLPALEGKTTSEVVRDNLNAMHSARKAFVASEASEKIRRALRHNVGSSVDVKYVTQDSVYYKRKNDPKWKGPGTVIGQDGQQVLVKHGSVYVRVHPCRLMLEKSEVQYNPPRNQEDVPNPDAPSTPRQLPQGVDSDSDDDDTQEITPTNNVEQQTEENGIARSVAGQMQDSVVQKNVTLPKPKQKVKYLPRDDTNWKTVEVISRAGKANGKYKHWLNIKNEDNTVECIDWKNSVQEWHPNESSDEEANGINGAIIEDSQEAETVFYSVNGMDVDPVLLNESKEKELANWRRNNVYQEVPDAGQKCVSTRWVFTEKFIDGKKSIKSRLVARGFEEDSSFQVNSPTCSKEALRLASTLMMTNGWKCNSIDVRAAFLQGKQIDRDVFIKPPPEVENKNIWKLNVCVYGLSDAPRAWYLRVKEVLASLGARCCKHDAGLFYSHKNGSLQGIIVIHVDDFFWGGTMDFVQKVIQPFKQTFEIGTEETGSFKYLGLNITQTKNGIQIEQTRYCQSIKPIPVSKERKTQRNLPLGSGETKQLRMLVGQMNWAATQTRPDILFDCCELASKMKNATVADILDANKVLKKLQNDVMIKLPPLKDINHLKFVVHSDASYANLNDGGSQGGYIILLSDDISKKLSPIAWQSKRIKRVVKSTLAAEMLALVEAAESCYWLQSILNEVLGTEGCRIECYIDSQSLYNAANSTTSLSDKRLRVDVAIIREMLQNNEISKLVWVPSKSQLADCLTKKGANTSSIVNVLTTNQL